MSQRGWGLPIAAAVWADASGNVYFATTTEFAPLLAEM